MEQSVSKGMLKTSNRTTFFVLDLLADWVLEVQ